VELSPERMRNLNRNLCLRLSSDQFRLPQSGESEPSFTRKVISGSIFRELENHPNLHLKYRGDGGNELAFPAAALDIQFFPDMAVSLGTQHIWAAEVKLLRSSNRQAALAAAIGQATLYRIRYDYVVVMLVDLEPASLESRVHLAELGKQLELNFVIRHRVGNVLAASDHRGS